MNDCPMCGEPVAYGDDERVIDVAGWWWHAPCWGANLEEDWFTRSDHPVRDESLAACAASDAEEPA